MPWHRRGRRLLRNDRDAKVAVASFLGFGLACLVLISVLLVAGETQLPETPAEAQVLGVHFSVEGADATKEVTINWFTDEPVRAPKLKWAKAGAPSTTTVDAQTETWYFLGDLLHYVRLQGLEAGQTYQFWPGDEDWGYAGPYNYTVPAKDLPVRIGVWGNIGSGGEAAKNRDNLLALDPDVIVGLGDLAYAAGDPKNWRTWYETHEPLFGTRLMLNALGHAEDEGSEVQKRGYYGTLRQPENEAYYAVRIGGVDLIVLDSGAINQGGSTSTAALDWLGRHLRSVEDDPTVHWKIAFMHHAPFATGLADNGRPLRNLVDPLFIQYGVQMVFSAHEGYYERTHLMSAGNNVVQNGTAFFEDLGAETPRGTVYWQSGGGGAALGTRGAKQDWLAHGDTIHHAIVLDVFPNGTAHVRGVKAADRAEFDHVWLGLGAIGADAGMPAVGNVTDAGNETAPGDGTGDDPTDDDATAEDPTPPAEDSGGGKKKKGSEEPGFELVAAVGAVAAVLFAGRRRKQP